MFNRGNVYIIAEIGNTHEGSLGLAKQFIKSASNCGVNAVKFQTHIFEAESLSDAPNPSYFNSESRKEYFERTAFNLEQYKELKRYATDECNIDFFSSPFSIEAVDMLIAAGVDVFKIPSGEVTNLPLLEYISSFGKKVILSSGMSNWQELDEAVHIFKQKCELVILQCTSEYPCLPENAGLNLLSEMRNRYNCEVGFSDHTIGIAVPIAAAVLGATVIEKHFTLSKEMYGSDAANSTEPSEFKVLVDSIRAVETAINHEIDKDLKYSQLSNMKYIFEKSIVSKRTLPPGHVIQFEDLTFKKPGDGINARLYKDVIGKMVKYEILCNEKISFNSLK
jgi:N,N'-diacetyllegionaminate synthase